MTATTGSPEVPPRRARAGTPHPDWPLLPLGPCLQGNVVPSAPEAAANLVHNVQQEHWICSPLRNAAGGVPTSKEGGVLVVVKGREETLFQTPLSPGSS